MDHMSNQDLIAPFTEVREHKNFLDRPVEETTLRRFHDIAEFAA